MEPAWRLLNTTVTAHRLGCRWRAQTRCLRSLLNVSSTRNPWPASPIAHRSRLQSTDAQERNGSRTTVQLRPYQEESIRAVLDYLKRGERRLGLSLATGSGKTVIFSHLIDRIPPPNRDAIQTLIVAHRQELVDQAANHCRSLYPDKTVDVDMAASQASGYADITVASVASLNSGSRLLKYDPARFKLVIVDEAHHIVASQYLSVLEHFRLIGDGRAGHIALVGVSATFSRKDGLSLGKAIDQIVYHNDFVSMIEHGWLAKVTFTTVRLGVDLSKVKTGRGDFQPGSLSKVVNNDEINTIVVRAWLEKAAGRRSTLVFCVDLNHVAALTSMFRRHGVDARFVTGSTRRKTRQERLEAFREGKVSVLLNCGVFTEGTDLPNIDCILLARPTKSRNLLVQMIGRGMRKHAGKDSCHIIDMVAALETGIVTTPTLFGLNPDELVDEASAEAMKSLKERKESEQLREQQTAISSSQSPELTGNVIFTDYQDVNDLLDDTSGERHIRAISPFAWVQVDQDRYVLSGSAGELIVAKDKQRYQIVFKQRLPEDAQRKSPFMHPREVAHASTFEQAVAAADHFARAKFVFEIISKAARWRKSPASEQQVALLNRSRADDDKLEVGSITKGKAGDLITKLKYGAKGRFNKIMSGKRKAERTEQKRARFDEAVKRAQVQVGAVMQG
ncbi:hypothetical protein BAUCODRAFT_33786 [Baudoinia panamericana UAMH 10762]|uniref:Helicase ATP-binding domain-containing protein n=1 Tax=Baudoinia panamericana (strain UAMH 10762) TaxID=717646 RepID=M2NC25_BAUPA|nr:uncharacterized protein BAUCODRAFT_33786 [Baudoinia panamericana UAMH 10762]EMC96435.1 hypothetical protein BAUCODRAFT_33786 [Baudoinia panamericana UAMH 10762]